MRATWPLISNGPVKLSAAAVVDRRAQFGESAQVQPVPSSSDGPSLSRWSQDEAAYEIGSDVKTAQSMPRKLMRTEQPERVCARTPATPEQGDTIRKKTFRVMPAACGQHIPRPDRQPRCLSSAGLED